MMRDSLRDPYTSAIEAIPIGDRVAAGFLQSVAVRAAGFGIIPLGALAPAVKLVNLHPLDFQADAKL
jgi:hypothetical protein